MKNKYPLLREPYESELEYFKKNPEVAGMATEDDRVIFNPHSKVIPKHSDSIYRNEAARVYMRKHNFRPNYEITDEQKNNFSNYGTPQDIKETIVGRGISGDESAGKLTFDQEKFIKELVNKMLREGWLND